MFSNQRAKATTPTNSNQLIVDAAGRKLTTSQEAMKATLLKLMDTCNELTEVLDEKEAKVKALDNSIAGSVKLQEKYGMQGILYFFIAQRFRFGYRVRPGRLEATLDFVKRSNFFGRSAPTYEAT